MIRKKGKKRQEKISKLYPKMNNKYIFDVDGTLTLSRQQIDHDFENHA